MPTELDDWFVREVLVHERALVLFLQRDLDFSLDYFDIDMRDQVQDLHSDKLGQEGRLQPTRISGHAGKPVGASPCRWTNCRR